MFIMNTKEKIAIIIEKITSLKSLRPRATCYHWFLCLICLCSLPLFCNVSSAKAATSIEAGYKDFAGGASCTSDVTGEKPESKLWWNDGLWWANMCNPSDSKYHIYRLNLATHDWIDSGAIVDERQGSKSDALWDQAAQKLYIVSHIFTVSGSASAAPADWGRLYRFSYDSGAKTYSLDPGFPVNVTRGKSETLTIAKDSTGRLWVAYTESGAVKVNHSASDDAVWGMPYTLSVSGAANLSSDDIASVIAFSGYIGIMWSNQSTKIMYFAAHNDSDTNDQNWQAANAYNPGGSAADDHINLKQLQGDSAGSVFAIAKTSLSNSTQPRIVLFACSAAPCTSASNWQAKTVWTVGEQATRPLLLIDTSNRMLYAFASDSDSGRGIYYKTSSLDAIGFSSGNGTPFILSMIDTAINNATSTKQNVNNTTGIVILASDVTSYFHNFMNLGGPLPNTAPNANAGINQLVTWPTNRLNLDATVSDDGLPNPPGQVTTTWSMLSGPGTVTFGRAIGAPATVDTTATFSLPGVYQLQLSASDGALSASDQIKITLNQSPTVEAGLDQLVTLPAVANLNGTISDDGLPSPVTQNWSKVSGPGAVTFTLPTAEDTAVAFAQSGTYVLRLTANDGAVGASDQVTVVVNAMPNLDAGLNQLVTWPVNSVALAGTVSDDGLPNPPAKLSLAWSKVSGPGAALFADGNALSTTVTFTQSGLYVLQLAADDGAVIAVDSVTITVNQPPAVDAGADQLITLPLTSVNLVGRVSDDGLPTTSGKVWSKVSGPGVVNFADAHLDHTTATFAQAGIYVLSLTANDGVVSVSDPMTVTVNQPPTVEAGTDQIVTLPSDSVALAGVIGDDGLPQALTKEWSMASGAGVVDFGNSASEQTMAHFRQAGVYVLHLTANDGAAVISDTVTITVNQPPVVEAGPNQVVTLPINSVRLNATVNDDGLPAVLNVLWSQVSGPGGVSFADSHSAATIVTFPVAGEYVLRVSVNDGVAVNSDQVTVVVQTPPAANQAPGVNAGPDQTILLSALVTLTGVISDDGLPNPPGAIASTWSKVSGPGNVVFADERAASTTASFSVAGVYVLRLTANDGGLTSADEITVNVLLSASPPLYLPLIQQA
jgi:hypothetical protein